MLNWFKTTEESTNNQEMTKIPVIYGFVSHSEGANHLVGLSTQRKGAKWYLSIVHTAGFQEPVDNQLDLGFRSWLAIGFHECRIISNRIRVHATFVVQYDDHPSLILGQFWTRTIEIHHLNLFAELIWIKFVKSSFKKIPNSRFATMNRDLHRFDNLKSI